MPQSSRRVNHKQPLSLLAAATVVWGAACAPAASSQTPAHPAVPAQSSAFQPSAASTPGVAGGFSPAARASVRLGVDVLMAGDLALLRGKRVGLITNHTGKNTAGESTIDLLHRHPDVKLVALFSPEHGIRGTVEAGEKVASGKDSKTGLPVYSLYGETRKPTAEMLRDVDVLVFDIQDVGTRYYTYVWTMAISLQAAAEQHIPFVVLDRPNPIGGEQVQGNVLDMAKATFVGLYPVPMRHGMTVGEIARFVNGEYHMGADLTVVPAEGWRRGQWFDQTALPWTAPSPSMPSLESALHYPGTCLYEGTNLSVGRGTTHAFQQIGAPWLDHEELARRLNAYHLPGARFDAVTFTPEQPGDGKFKGEVVHGVRFVATDRTSYDPTIAAVAALVEIQKLHPEKLTWSTSHFDRLAGTENVRKQVLAGASMAEITAGWKGEVERFEGIRKQYLIYR